MSPSIILNTHTWNGDDPIFTNIDTNITILKLISEFILINLIIIMDDLTLCTRKYLIDESDLILFCVINGTIDRTPISIPVHILTQLLEDAEIITPIVIILKNKILLKFKYIKKKNI